MLVRSALIGRRVATTVRGSPHRLRAMSRRTPQSDWLVDRLQKLSLGQGLAVAATLFLIGLSLPIVIPAGEGWVSLLAQSQNLFLALALFVAAVTGYAALRRSLERRRFDSDVNLSDLTWDEFEGHLAEYYRRRGTSVTYRGGASSDGGVDLVLDDATGRRVVQAKHWKARSVGVVPLRALWGVREDERANGAVCVTSGTFTREALRFAQGKRLELIDGNQLRRLVAEVKSAPGASASVVVTSSTNLERCPDCGQGTVTKRLARKGPRAGLSFLGCSRYPACGYTRDT